MYLIYNIHGLLLVVKVKMESQFALLSFLPWISSIIKFVVFVWIGFLLWFIYVFVVNPFLVRRKYAKYPNVKQSKDFQFMKGDLYEIIENENKGAFRYWHYAEMALEDNPPDLYLKFSGPRPILLMFSPKAIREFAKLVPSKIDRNDYFLDRYLGKMFYGSLASSKSTERWKLRRDTSMKMLGINFASRYIQLLVENVKEGISKLEVGKEINFTSAFTDIEFDFTCKLLFGKDFGQLISKIPFKTADGTFEEIGMGECIYRLLLDTYATSFSDWNIKKLNCER